MPTADVRRSTLAERIGSTLSGLGLTLPPEAPERLEAYLTLLDRWNDVYNLTSVKDPEQRRLLHLNDCLAIVGPIRARAQARGRPLRTLIDVGTGAGLPAVVLALAFPDVAVHCVDAVGKKVAFVTQAAGAMRLGNLRAHHARVEALRPGPALPAADLVTSRAFAALADFVAGTRALRADDGEWLAMKGQWPQAEVDALPPDVTVAARQALAVPELDAERHLLWLAPAPRPGA